MSGHLKSKFVVEKSRHFKLYNDQQTYVHKYFQFLDHWTKDVSRHMDQIATLNKEMHAEAKKLEHDAANFLDTITALATIEAEFAKIEKSSDAKDKARLKDLEKQHKALEKTAEHQRNEVNHLLDKIQSTRNAILKSAALPALSTP
ncbi:MAG: hypothetical protein ACFBRM_01155 [Pikeienuella sp.]